MSLTHPHTRVRRAATRRPASDRFAARRRRLVMLRGRLIAVAVLVTLALWGAVFYGLVSERAESHAVAPRAAAVAPRSTAVPVSAGAPTRAPAPAGA